MIFVLRPENFATNYTQRKQRDLVLEELYKDIFHNNFERLFHYSFTIVGNNEDARDIAQTAFIKLWEKRNQIRFEQAARSYLYTTVYNLSLNTVRNQKNRKNAHDSLKIHQAEVNYYSAEQKENLRRIYQAIEALPTRCKEVFCKSRFESKKYLQIATELNISQKTVEAQMSKALKLLKEQLADLVLILLFYIMW